MILLDTDAIIDVSRGFPAALAWFGTMQADEPLGISGFTAMEVVRGCRNRVDQRRMLRVLSRFEILWLTSDDCNRAFELFAAYRLSHGAGILDTLVGYTAIKNKHPIVTFNTKHFGFLPGIQMLRPYNRSEPA